MMAAVSFSSWLPDLRLGLLLLVAVLLLNGGGSAPFWPETFSDRLDITSARYGLIAAVAGLGALAALIAAIVAAIWTDRGQPHRIMAAGALLLALNPLLALGDSFALFVVLIFLTGVGGAFTGPLIFYAVAVKGALRFKGTLIGALGMLFSIRMWTEVIDAWSFNLPFGWWTIAMVVAGGALLLLLLPRWSTVRYGPGPTLRETLRVPGAKPNVAWVAAVCLVTSLISAAGATSLGWGLVQDEASPELGFRRMVLGGGIGALLWGIAADFFPVRGLLIAVAALSLLAGLSLWLPGGGSTDMFILSVIRGGLISLPWILMADCLPIRHFAKLALAVSWVGSMGSSLALLGESLGLYFWGWTRHLWAGDSFILIVLVEAVLLAGVVSFRPRAPEPAG